MPRLFGIEKIAFAGAATLTFHNTFFAGLQSIVGDQNANRIDMYLTKPATFSMDGLILALWTSGVDIIAINGSAGNDNITGSRVADIIRGNAGNDTLFGEFANDRMYGGTGNDIISGGAGNDVLDGGAGSDTLNGGAGIDTLYGREGADFFQFLAPLASTNVDRIADFSAIDAILLSKSVFGVLPLGQLSAEAFATGTVATESDDRIIYNTVTGGLVYDANGSAAGGAVKFAQLTGAPPLSAADFVVAM